MMFYNEFMGLKDRTNLVDRAKRDEEAFKIPSTIMKEIEKVTSTFSTSNLGNDNVA